MAGRTVTVSIGRPSDTGEECPLCHFDAVMASLVSIDGVPARFVWLCGRCRVSIKEPEV